MFCFDTFCQINYITLLLLLVVFESSVDFRFFLIVLRFGRLCTFLYHAVYFFLEARAASAALGFFIFLVHNQ